MIIKFIFIGELNGIQEMWVEYKIVSLPLMNRDIEL